MPNPQNQFFELDTEKTAPGGTFRVIGIELNNDLVQDRLSTPTAIHELVGQHARELSAKLQAHRLQLFPPGCDRVQFERSGQAGRVNDGISGARPLEGKGPAVDTSPSGRAPTPPTKYSGSPGIPGHEQGDRHYVPRRGASEPLQVISIVNFKGGRRRPLPILHNTCLALRGYRVLAIDLDPQASLSALHGVQPEFDIGEDQTLYGAMRYTGVRRDLKDIIRRTYFANLDLVPANLELMEFEHETPKALANGVGGAFFSHASTKRWPRLPTATMSSSSIAHRSSVTSRCSALPRPRSWSRCTRRNARRHVDVPIPHHDVRPPECCHRRR